ncbi:MAG TPA: pre-toxin TG domain-containing protein, partial [Chloroflexota bacterium]|nr:pre-toxin TG domain-containing protein [Chloroflexota bacterium]
MGLATSLFDGVYLLAWPRVAAVASPLALLLGLVFGALHPGYRIAFSESLPLLVLMVVLGTVSGHLGVLFLAGYAFGDFSLAAGEWAAGSAVRIPAGREVSIPVVAIASIQERGVILAGIGVLASVVRMALQGMTAYLRAYQMPLDAVQAYVQDARPVISLGERLPPGVVALALAVPEVAWADNCRTPADCFGTQRSALAALLGTLGLAFFSLTLDLIPGVGQVKGIIEGITGRDLVTGEKLAAWERAIGWIPIVGRAGDVAGVAAGLGRAADNLGDLGRVADDLGDAGRAGDAAGDVSRAAGATDTAGDATRAAGGTRQGGDLLEGDGAFRDPELESAYRRYVERKERAGQTLRGREDWKEARDYWLDDSPMARGQCLQPHLTTSAAVGAAIEQARSVPGALLDLGESWAALHFLLTGEIPMPREEA